jgi:hypothetical protein
MADPVAALKDIAKQSRKTVRTLNLIDPRVGKGPVAYFRHQLSIECKGRKVRLYANSHFIVGQVSGSFAIDAFSINRRDLDKREVPLRISSFPTLPVFARKSSGHLEDLLNSAALRRTLEDLRLKETESLHLYRDAINFFLQSSSVSDIMSAIEVTCGLAEELPAGNEEKIDLTVLPPEFKILIPLIRKWGVTDDLERTELLEKASRKVLERLVESVVPHLSSINKYLDSFGEVPPSEAAVALGAVAECAVEAQLHLGHPKSK